MLFCCWELVLTSDECSYLSAFDDIWIDTYILVHCPYPVCFDWRIYSHRKKITSFPPELSWLDHVNVLTELTRIIIINDTVISKLVISSVIDKVLIYLYSHYSPWLVHGRLYCTIESHLSVSPAVLAESLSSELRSEWGLAWPVSQNQNINTDRDTPSPA